jgi:hypothetical protein
MNSMKQFLVTILLLACHFAAAEYNGWYITFKITTTANQEITGHTYKASAYLDEDSLESSTYLIRHLNRVGLTPDDPVFRYSKDLLEYTYVPILATETAKAYSLLNERSIPLAEIKRIVIIDMIDFGYLLNIAGNHSLVDTIWMKTPALESAYVDGYLCSYEVYVHEQSENTIAVLREMSEFNAKNKGKIEAWEAEMKDAMGAYYQELEQKINDFQESLDEKASKIMAKLAGEKVVIISFCSC